MSWTRSTFGSRVIIFITVLLAVVFFISALLHLLIRYLVKQRSRTSSNNYPQISTSSGAFQRQLQQLFQLHDSGLDQAHVDSLPVFSYKDIVGSKEPFDCAVCLCEFSEEDNLRLLPLCSHAFHIDCIDTWLLSNSTCPLCRGVILSENQNPVFCFDDCKETEDHLHLGTANAGFLGVIRPNQGDNNSAAISEKRVFSVRLGKFKNITNCDSFGHLHHHHHHHENEHVGETSNSHLDARRCYSMGSFQYVVAELDLQVALCSNVRDRNGAETERPLKGRGGLYGNFTIDEEQEDGDGIGKKINSGVKGESFSISKIWLWSKKGQSSSGSYLNAVNFNLP